MYWIKWQVKWFFQLFFFWLLTANYPSLSEFFLCTSYCWVVFQLNCVNLAGLDQKTRYIYRWRWRWWVERVKKWTQNQNWLDLDLTKISCNKSGDMLTMRVSKQREEQLKQEQLRMTETQNCCDWRKQKTWQIKDSLNRNQSNTQFKKYQPKKIKKALIITDGWIWLTYLHHLLLHVWMIVTFKQLSHWGTKSGPLKAKNWDQIGSTENFLFSSIRLTLMNHVFLSGTTEKAVLLYFILFSIYINLAQMIR